MSEESKEKAQPLTYWDRVADKGLRKYIKDKGLPLSVRIRLPCVPASRRETFHISKISLLLLFVAVIRSCVFIQPCFVRRTSVDLPRSFWPSD